MFKRAAGILLPISSLPSDYGIGTLGIEAYKFIDFLKSSKQKYWQILPIGPTSYGDSPYQSFSTYAGNPYFIDLDLLKKQGLLKKEDYINIDFGNDPVKIDYEKLFNNRIHVLKKAYSNIDGEIMDRMMQFEEENNWVSDYALFMSLKYKNEQKPWQDWNDKLKYRNENTLKEKRIELEDEIGFWIFIQYIFYKQWMELKKYANKNGIEIIGDMPIYVATDSCDTWANCIVFEQDDQRNPVRVAGCPPDFFTEEGQLWGNMLYNWEYLKNTEYEWWIKRISYAFKIYDVLRIDHFRAFDTYWAIPYGDETAKNGCWEYGPGREFFDVIKNKLGDVKIIAEDLGDLFDSVRDLLEYTKFPGMKILQFAFNPFDKSDYLPHRHKKNCVVYTGTHDNDTTKGWLSKVSKDEFNYVKQYLNLNDNEKYVWGIIRAAYSSVADTIIIPVQDYLDLGSNSRINKPSTTEGNWQFRITKDMLNELLSKKIADYVEIYDR